MVFKTLCLYCITMIGLASLQMAQVVIVNLNGKSVEYIASESELNSPLPVVIWHGMGDSCFNPLSMGRMRRLIEAHLGPNSYVICLLVGSSVSEDIENSYFMNVNKQVDDICRQLAEDKRLEHGYNAIGFSQGAQFLRAVAQRCPSPQMNNLISIGGQHQGVFGLPHCLYPDHKLCKYLAKILSYGAYEKFVQDYFVQAQYWHDPLKEEVYKEKSVFLADINNENKVNDTYRQNLMKLNNLVLVKFESDQMVIPIASEWFGYFTPGQLDNITAMQDTDLYRQDRIGLKYLSKQGKIHFLSLPGNHLEFTDQWFIDNIINQFLAADSNDIAAAVSL